MKKVLFLCTGNTARSQMAEALLRDLSEGEFEVHSAGLTPGTVNPLAIKAMEEIGIDISRQQSTDVRDYLGTEFDFIITVCQSAGQKCPVFPGAAKRFDWNVDDPAEADGDEEERLEAFREARDELESRIVFFLRDLPS